jgi:hypothetical protein
MAYFGAGGFAALSVGRSNISTNPNKKKKNRKERRFSEQNFTTQIFSRLNNIRVQ